MNRCHRILLVASLGWKQKSSWKEEMVLLVLMNAIPYVKQKRLVRCTGAFDFAKAFVRGALKRCQSTHSGISGRAFINLEGMSKIAWNKGLVSRHCHAASFFLSHAHQTNPTCQGKVRRHFAFRSALGSGLGRARRKPPGTHLMPANYESKW